MKVLVHTIFYKPELTGVAKYTAELCEWLTAQGHEVRVIAPPPYYPQWRVQEPYGQWRYKNEVLEGVHVQRCPIWLPRRPSGLARSLYSLSFMLASELVVLREVLRRPDMVLVIEPSFMNLPSAWLASRIAGAVAWLHIQDFEIDLAYDLGQLRHGRRLAMAVESWLMKRFDIVSSITRRMIEKAASKGVPSENLYMLPNWVDTSIVRPLPHPSPMRREMGISRDCVVAMFSGSLGTKQGVETIIDAARTLVDDSRLLFVICGDGASSEALRLRARDLNNVRFLPLQPAERLNDLLNLADLHLLPQLPSAAGSVMPSKLIGMLASGRPVVAACSAGTEIAELVTGCGVTVEPGDSGGYAAAIRTLAHDARFRAQLGESARRRALERFSQDSILGDFERELNRRLPSLASHNAAGLASE
jgi:putative colanic acid biosynthesis glycosyltransferase WcaI